MKAKIIDVLLTVLQWAVWVAIFTVFGLGLFWAPRALMEGAPLIAYCVGMAAITMALIAHFPLLFRKLRLHWKSLYAGLALAVTVSIATLLHLSNFYYATPEGIAFADRTAREAESSRLTAQNREILATLDAPNRASDEGSADSRQDLRRCRLAVAMAIRNSLHNPDSFEEVTTQVDRDSNEIAVTYQGENGFGATRTETARARVDPSDCSITAMTNSAD